MISFLDFLKIDKKFLLEFMPYFYDEELPLQSLSSLSSTTIKLEYSHIGYISTHDIDLYENKQHGGIIAGRLIEDEFYSIIRIACEERNLYVNSMQLNEKRKQIKMVNTDKHFTRFGIANDVYVFIATKFDLISDRIQYKGAKALWKAIARQKRINVYVFDESLKDYLRDEQGHIILYNGSNIDDDDIWGTEDNHHSRLLVAVDRDLQ
jgi:hypothetical protein